MKHAPRSHQRHDLYANYHHQDSKISALLGECGFKVAEGYGDVVLTLDTGTTDVYRFQTPSAGAATRAKAEVAVIQIDGLTLTADASVLDGVTIVGTGNLIVENMTTEIDVDGWQVTGQITVKGEVSPIQLITLDEVVTDGSSVPVDAREATIDESAATGEDPNDQIDDLNDRISLGDILAPGAPASAQVVNDAQIVDKDWETYSLLTLLPIDTSYWHLGDTPPVDAYIVDVAEMSAPQLYMLSIVGLYNTLATVPDDPNDPWLSYFNDEDIKVVQVSGEIDIPVYNWESVVGGYGYGYENWYTLYSSAVYTQLAGYLFGLPLTGSLSYDPAEISFSVFVDQDLITPHDPVIDLTGMGDVNYWSYPVSADLFWGGLADTGRGSYTSPTINVGAAGSNKVILKLNSDLASDLIVGGAGEVEVYIVGTTSDANLSLIVNTGSRTAIVSDDVTFTGNLGTFSTTVASGKTLTAAASVLSGKTITGLGTVAITGISSTTVLTGLDADLTVAMNIATNTDISTYGNISGVDQIALASGVNATMTMAQHAKIAAAAGTNIVTIFDAGTFTANAQVESYVLSGAGANDITLTAAAQGVTTAADASNQSVDTGELTTISGAFIGNLTATDILDITTTATNISTATGLTTAGNWNQINLANNVSATMTADQHELITGAAGTNTVTLTDAFANAALLDADVEAFVLAAGANSVTTSAIGQTINASALLETQVLTLAGTHNVTVTLVAGDLTSTSSGNITVTATTGTNVITTGSGDDTITGGAGADTLAGGLGADTFVFVSDATVGAEINHSTTAAADVIIDFQASVTGTLGDRLDISLVNAGGVNVVSAAVADGNGSGVAANVTFSVTNGILTLGDAGATDVDTLGEWLTEAAAVAAVDGNVLAFEFGVDTYVFAQNGAQDLLIKLAGLTGADALATAAVANADTILFADI